MVIAVILSVLLLLLLSILLAPIVLNIDTIKNEYYVRVKGLVKASLEPHETEIFRIRVHTFFMNFYVYPLQKKKKKKVKPKEKGIKKFRKKANLSKIIRLIRTFKIKRLFLDLDTGDFVWNAKLFPVFVFLNNQIGGMSINFQGRTNLVLQIENKLIYILKELLTRKKLNYGFTF